MLGLVGVLDLRVFRDFVLCGNLVVLVYLVYLVILVVCGFSGLMFR